MATCRRVDRSGVFRIAPVPPWVRRRRVEIIAEGVRGGRWGELAGGMAARLAHRPTIATTDAAWCRYLDALDAGVKAIAEQPRDVWERVRADARGVHELGRGDQEG